MKIVHVTITSNVFGKDYAYQDNLLSKAHRKMGHDVSIVSSTYSNFDPNTGKTVQAQSGEETIGDNIRLIRLKPVFPWFINHSIHVFWGFRKTIERLNPDIIFAHGIASLNYRFFSQYKKTHPNVKIVFDNHADFNNSCQKKLRYLYSRYIVRHFVMSKIEETSNHFYGVTPARCDFLHDMYAAPLNKISLLPMGADDDDMHFENKEIIRKDVRLRYNIKDDDFLIVTGGKIDPLKNIHVLAEAVSNISNKHIKMIIFGSIRDDLKKVFERLRSERIKCIGWIPSNEVYRYFYAADIVMFPGLHSVLWEQAVASQVPCAFSKIKGFEHVDIGGNCVLMDEKSVDYYKTLIEKIYTDKGFYSELFMNAHSDQTYQFLYSNIAQKVLDDIMGE